MDNYSNRGRGRPGWKFDGWFVDEARTMRLNPGANLPHHVTIYDKWVPVEYPVTYQLEYGVNNRRNPRTVSVVTGISKLFAPIQNQAFFAGWFWKGQRVDYLPEGLHEPVELTARFESVPVISFDTNGGSHVAARLVSAAGYLAPFRPPMKPGFVFAGWFEDENLQIPFSFQKKIRENMLLYAGWKEKGFQIHYDLDGGYFEEEPVEFYGYDTPTFWLPVPKKTGYRFAGWQDRVGQGITHIPVHSMMDRYVQAVWLKNIPEVHAMKGVRDTFARKLPARSADEKVPAQPEPLPEAEGFFERRRRSLEQMQKPEKQAEAQDVTENPAVSFQNK